MGEGGVQEGISNVQLTDELFVKEEENVVDSFVGRTYRGRKLVKKTG
jgi:hypothetical protein